MPSGLLNADIGFPSFTGQETTEQKVGQISNYLYMLLEQLRYSLSNISVDNMTEASVQELTEIVTNPVNITIGNMQSQITEQGATITRQAQQIVDITRTVSDQSVSLTRVEQKADTNTAAISSVTQVIGPGGQYFTEVKQQSSLNNASITSIVGNVGNGNTVTAASIALAINAAGSSAMIKADNIVSEAGRSKMMMSNGELNLINGTSNVLGIYSALDYAYISAPFGMTINSNDTMSISASNTLNLLGGNVNVGGAGMTINIDGYVYINGRLIT